MLVCHGESLGWVDLLLWEAGCWRWIDLAAVRTVIDLGGCWEKAWLVKMNNYCGHWRWWFVVLIWLLKARTTAVCWRWWLPPVSSTALSVANGGGATMVLWTVAGAEEDDTGWGAAFAAVNPNRCWLWWVLWVSASGLMMETMNSDFEHWIVGSCDQNSRFWTRIFFPFFRSNRI